MRKSWVYSVTFLAFFLLSVLPVFAEDGEEGRGYYDFGVFAYEDGDYEGALFNLEKALSLNPDEPAYHHYMAKTLARMKQTAEAGNHYARAWRDEPTLPGLSYDYANFLYETEKYAQAVPLFQKTIANEPANVLARYYCGICLYKTQEYEKALDYFLKAAEASPTIKDNGYYYAGICYLQINEFDRAVEKLTYVRDNAKSASLKQHAVKWLENVSKREKAFKPYNLMARFEVRYDDNVMAEPLDLDLYADEGDWLGQLTFIGKYNLVNKAKTNFGIGYTHVQSWYEDLKEFNLIGAIPMVYFKHQQDTLTYDLKFMPTYFWLDDSDYMSRYQLAPEIAWQVSASTRLKFGYMYSDNAYADTKDKDGDTSEITLGLIYKFKDDRGSVMASAAYEDTTAALLTEAYERVKVKGTLSMKLPWSLTFALKGDYQEKDYQAVHPTYLVIRQDERYVATLTLSRPLVYKWLRVGGEYSYTKNNSNILDYEHKRNTYSVSLSATF